jgi:deoxyinosine 3'endonuclease (endonuclease V)
MKDLKTIDGDAHTTRDAAVNSVPAADANTNEAAAVVMEEIKQVWIVQQQKIAEAVVVIDDDDDALLTGSSYDDRLLFDLFDLHDAELTTRLVGGTDISFPTTCTTDDAVAVYTVMRQGTVVYSAHQFVALQLPYIPGFLAFREIDPLVELIEEQRRTAPHLTPDVILVDGNGVWHERSAGLASALGVRLQMPTIGVGKTLYNAGGWHKGLLEPLLSHVLRQAVEQRLPDEQQQAGNDTSSFPDGFLAWRRKVIDTATAQSCCLGECPDQKGTLVKRLSSLSSETRGALRGVALTLVSDHDPHMKCGVLIGHGGRHGSRHDAACTKPIFVSIGHMVSLRQAMTLVCNLAFVRIPEPIRQADLQGRELMREKERKATKPHTAADQQKNDSIDDVVRKKKPK